MAYKEPEMMDCASYYYNQAHTHIGANEYGL